MKIFIFVLMFFAVSALLIISNHNLSMYDKENIKEFSDLYVGWIGGVFSNFQDITGDAVKLKWLPE